MYDVDFIIINNIMIAILQPIQSWLFKNFIVPMCCSAPTFKSGTRTLIHSDDRRLFMEKTQIGLQQIQKKTIVYNTQRNNCKPP